MKRCLLALLAVFVVVIMAVTINTPAFAAAKKPTEKDVLIIFKNGWAHAAKKNFFNVVDVKKLKAQTLSVNGVSFYKMRVMVSVKSIWDVVACFRSNPFDNTNFSLHMMRKGEYDKLSEDEKDAFKGRSLGSVESCNEISKVENQSTMYFLRTVLYEEFEDGYEIANKKEALQLNLYEQHLVGEEADEEIKKMDGLQGDVTRSLTNPKPNKK